MFESAEKIIAGNWKMNLLPGEGLLLVNELVNNLEVQKTKVILAPPFPYLSELSKKLKSKPGFYLAAQNCHHKSSGAFTGEVAPQMLKAMGVEYVILGHSERRSLFGESDEWIAKKIQNALTAGLNVIYCCGETLEDRDAGKQFDRVRSQVLTAFNEFPADRLDQVVIAYEPVWAIGTGKTASPEQANEMHAHIRDLLAAQFGKNAAQTVPILYGGSVKSGNAPDLLSCPDIDGALVGGASLVADEFIEIVRSAEKL